MDGCNVKDLRFFEECHIAAIPAIKNSHSELNQIAEDVKKLEVEEVLQKYSLPIEEKVFLEVMKIFATKKDNELIKSIAEVTIKEGLCGSNASKNFFNTIISGHHNELAKTLFSMEPNLVKKLFITAYEEATNPKLSEPKKREITIDWIRKNYFEITGKQVETILDKKTKNSIKKIKDSIMFPNFLKFIFLLRKENSNELQNLNNILESLFKDKNALRSFIFDNLGVNYEQIKPGIYNHILPLNSLTGTILSQTINMASEVNHGIDDATDILSSTVVPKLLTNFSLKQNASEVDLNNAIEEYKQILIDTYSEYAKKANSNTSTLTPKLEDVIENIPLPDDDMQLIFNELNKDTSLYDLVNIGLSYLGHLCDTDQHHIKIRDVLNYITDPNSIQIKISELQEAINKGSTDVEHLRLLGIYNTFLNSLEDIKSKIDNLQISDDILNKEIQTSPYGSMHNFIAKYEASIAEYCSRVTQHSDASNFERALLSENLTLDDSSEVATPVVDFLFCEGKGNQFCWERV